MKLAIALLALALPFAAHADWDSATIPDPKAVDMHAWQNKDHITDAEYIRELKLHGYSQAEAVKIAALHFKPAAKPVATTKMIQAQSSAQGANTDARDMHVFQMCPSTDYETCVQLHKELAQNKKPKSDMAFLVSEGIWDPSDIKSHIDTLVSKANAPGLSEASKHSIFQRISRLKDIEMKQKWGLDRKDEKVTIAVIGSEPQKTHVEGIIMNSTKSVK